MSTRNRLVVVHPDAATLAEAVAARLLVRILDLQSLHSPVHVVLTGGTVGIETLACVDRSPLRDAVDWTGVHLWWGDERFLPEGHDDRNETQARRALLDRLAVPAENVHPMAADDGVIDVDEAAVRYAAELARFATHGAEVPSFDVTLLGMGPDAHVASLFPEHVALAAVGSTTGVHGSPKPPAERVSLTFGAIQASREVWIVAAGAPKADAVARGLAHASLSTTPVSGATGSELTLWLLDAEAAGR